MACSSVAVGQSSAASKILIEGGGKRARARGREREREREKERERERERDRCVCECVFVFLVLLPDSVIVSSMGGYLGPRCLDQEGVVGK